MKMIKFFVVLALMAFLALPAFAGTDPKLLKKAEAGDAQAQSQVAESYLKDQDYKKAFTWYSKAANQGLAHAQYNLGVLYAEGQGVPQDDKKAVAWYGKAASRGDAEAQYNLGQMYRTGRGAPRDDKKAAAWYTEAANQGFAEAQSNLGGMYVQGLGVRQDIVTGCAWIYASGNANNSAYCDTSLTPEQKRQALKKKDELTPGIAL
jgi:TPR repeat protein